MEGGMREGGREGGRERMRINSSRTLLLRYLIAVASNNNVTVPRQDWFY